VQRATTVGDEVDIVNEKHWDSAYLRQGTSYQCRYLANQY